MRKLRIIRNERHNNTSRRTTLIFYTPALTVTAIAAIASSSSHGSVENNVWGWGVSNLHGGRVGDRIPTQGHDAFATSIGDKILDSVSFKPQHRHQTATSTASNEYEVDQLRIMAFGHLLILLHSNPDELELDNSGANDLKTRR